MMYDRLMVLKNEMLLFYDLTYFLWSPRLSGSMFNNPDV